MKELSDGIVEIFRECFEGSPHEWSYIVTNGKDTGILGTIAAVDADAASHRLPGKNSLASHVNHVTEYLAAANRAAKGEEFKVDWEGTWKKQEYTAEEWDELRARIKREYEEALTWTGSESTVKPDFVIYALTFLAHNAYHLGAMRQLNGS